MLHDYDDCARKMIFSMYVFYSFYDELRLILDNSMNDLVIFSRRVLHFCPLLGRPGNKKGRPEVCPWDASQILPVD